MHLPEKPLVSPRGIPGADIIPPTQSDIGGAASAISSVTSQAKSAASAVATDVAGADTMIPRNCSLGTKEFCVGFSNREDCTHLPVDVSKIFPASITSLASDQAGFLQPLEGILQRVTPAYIQDPLIFGLALTLVMAVIFASSNLSWPFGSVIRQLGPTLTLGLSLVIGLACCLIFFVPMVICLILRLEAQKLHSNVETKEGNVGSYCLGAFLSAIVLMVLTAFTRIFIERCVT